MPVKKWNISKMDKMKNDIMELINQVIDEMNPSNLVRRNLEIRDHTLIIAGRYRVKIFIYI